MSDISLNEFAAATGMELNEVLDRFSDNSSLLVRMLKKFPSDRAFYDIEAAMEKCDYASASGAAHSLKGLSGNLGFEKIYEITREMNQAGKMRDYSSFDDLFSMLKQEYDRIVTIIQELE